MHLLVVPYVIFMTLADISAQIGLECANYVKTKIFQFGTYFANLTRISTESCAIAYRASVT